MVTRDFHVKYSYQPPESAVGAQFKSLEYGTPDYLFIDTNTTPQEFSQKKASLLFEIGKITDRSPVLIHETINTTLRKFIPQLYVSPVAYVESRVGGREVMCHIDDVVSSMRRVRFNVIDERQRKHGSLELYTVPSGTSTANSSSSASHKVGLVYNHNHINSSLAAEIVERASANFNADLLDPVLDSLIQMHYCNVGERNIIKAYAIATGGQDEPVVSFRTPRREINVTRQGIFSGVRNLLRV